MGQSLDDKRREYRCALPGFDRRRWDPAMPRGYYMGRLPVLDGSEGNPMEPPDRNDDGCPGSWYRSPFARSLIPYQRTGSGGVLNENLRLTRCDDPLVIDAVQYLEQEQIRANGWNTDRMVR